MSTRPLRLPGLTNRAVFSRAPSDLCWVHMSKTHPPKNEGQAPATKDDLVRLVVNPLAGQMNQAWLHLVQKMQEIQDAVDIIARQTARQIPKEE